MIYVKINYITKQSVAMYILFNCNDGTTIYCDVPKNPTITIFQDEEFGDWIAALFILGFKESVVINIGSRHECNEVVNILLQNLGCEPKRIN